MPIFFIAIFWHYLLAATATGQRRRERKEKG